MPDGWYHVFGRGWERRAIFDDDRDRDHFMELLGGLNATYRFVIHAYVNGCGSIVGVPSEPMAVIAPRPRGLR